MRLSCCNTRTSSTPSAAAVLGTTLNGTSHATVMHDVRGHGALMPAVRSLSAARQLLAVRARTLPKFQPQWRLRPVGALTIDMPTTDVWDEDAKAAFNKLLEEFNTADADGNGVIDKDELRNLLEGFDRGKQYSMKHWLTDDDVTRVMKQYDRDGSGDISFEEFTVLAQDGVLLGGKLEEYEAAFRAADRNGNGTIGATELSALFAQMGEQVNYDRLCKVFEEYDLDKNGEINFFEFLRMFRTHLLDLKEIMDYIGSTPVPAAAIAKMPTTEEAPPAGVEVVPGEVNMISSEAELDTVLKEHPGQLVVLMASLTWCRPCKGMQGCHQKLAAKYKDIIHLKFFGNTNDGTKDLFKNRLKARVTPTFYFYRGGELVHTHTGANNSRLEFYLRQFEPKCQDEPLSYPPYQVPGSDT